MKVFECLISEDPVTREKAEGKLEVFKECAVGLCRKAIPDDVYAFLSEKDEENGEEAIDNLIVDMYLAAFSAFLFAEME